MWDSRFAHYLSHNGIRVVGERHALTKQTNHEQCVFCGEPATHWPHFPHRHPNGELALVEEHVEPMCGCCFEDCGEMRGSKGKQGT